ncbi:hypothetical protein D3C71_2058850 [compost metagenome]
MPKAASVTAAILGTGAEVLAAINRPATMHSRGICTNHLRSFILSEPRVQKIIAMAPTR